MGSKVVPVKFTNISTKQDFEDFLNKKNFFFTYQSITIQIDCYNVNVSKTKKNKLSISIGANDFNDYQRYMAAFQAVGKLGLNYEMYDLSKDQFLNHLVTLTQIKQNMLFL